MAYRPSRKSSRSRASNHKVKLSQVLPIWTVSQTETTNALFASMLVSGGVYDIPSYWRRHKVWIVISMVLGVCIGGGISGWTGIFVGAVAGFIAPVALMWLAWLLFCIALYLLGYLAAMAVILWLLWWFVGGVFGK